MYMAIDAVSKVAAPALRTATCRWRGTEKSPEGGQKAYSRHKRFLTRLGRKVEWRRLRVGQTELYNTLASSDPAQRSIASVGSEVARKQRAREARDRVLDHNGRHDDLVCLGTAVDCRGSVCQEIASRRRVAAGVEPQAERDARPAGGRGRQWRQEDQHERALRTIWGHQVPRRSGRIGPKGKGKGSISIREEVRCQRGRLQSHLCTGGVVAIG